MYIQDFIKFEARNESAVNRVVHAWEWSHLVPRRAMNTEHQRRLHLGEFLGGFIGAELGDEDRPAEIARRSCVGVDA